jgi:predicted transcriptional regulator
MKLIGADALKEYCMNASKSDDDFRRVSLATLASVIDAQPTAYDVDKVVGQLEETKAYMLYENMNADVKWFNKAIEIVKGGGTDEE